MPAIKSMAVISEKWATVTPGRAQFYETGVSTTPKDWAGSTAAAQSTYNAGVSEAMARGAFADGVSKAGTSTWRSQTLAKKGRWAEGVRLGKENYTKGYAPFRSVIESVSLPPRGPRGDAGNYARVQALGDALSAARKAGS